MQLSDLTIKNYTPGAYGTQVTIGLLDKATKAAKQIQAIYSLDNTNPLFKTPKPNIIALAGEQDSIPFFNHPVIYNKVAYLDARAY